MVKKSLLPKLNVLSVVSFVTLFIILISVFVLSGNFSDLITTITKSKASQVNPRITQSFVDPFKDGVINEGKWTVNKSDGVMVREMPSDNLRIDIASGSANNKAHGGTLTFKELLKDDGDFRVMVVVYRPIVKGEGVGATGIRFSSKGNDDDEAAVVRWDVNGSSSKVLFAVNAANGKRLELGRKDLTSNVGVLRLDRVNKKYRAFYKVGSDLSADTDWISLGNEVENSTLGNEGSVSLFVNNAGQSGKFPSVVGRIDQINIGWEGAPRNPATTIGFSDPFANGVIGAQWNMAKSEGVQIYENASDNLIMSLSSGSVNGRPRNARVTRINPVVPENKNFTLNVSLFKPTVVGLGVGFSSIAFVSNTNVDDEGALIRWIVSGTTVSKLVFVVRAPDGTLSEKTSVSLAANMKKLSVRLARRVDRYVAHYRTGDLDTDWVAIGRDESSNFGAAGKFRLEVNNVGSEGKFPRVVGRFDHVSGNVSK